ncbi:helix-turn-helix domain-containing protein [Lacticaseibacillus sp. 53-4]
MRLNAHRVLLAAGTPIKEVALITGIGRSTVYRIIKRDHLR